LVAYFGLLFAFLNVSQYSVSFLPRHPLGWANWLAVAASALAAGWIVISRLDARRLGALGFPLHRHAAREALTGFGFGSVVFMGAGVLLVGTASAGFRADEGGIGGYGVHLAGSLAFFWIAAAAEELLFRGYAFQALVEWAGVWPAVVLTSGLFSWMHAGNPGVDPIAFANIFVAGVMLALAYLRTRSLWFATAAHAGWNWTMASVMDFPVSGLTSLDAPLYDVVERGADWWTGGPFGPEAGLAGSIALIAATGWLLRTPRLRQPAETRALRPLVDARERQFDPPDIHEKN
jgi:membrane protease YdiL (CAAX protease family)